MQTEKSKSTCTQCCIALRVTVRLGCMCRTLLSLGATPVVDGGEVVIEDGRILLPSDAAPEEIAGEIRLE